MKNNKECSICGKAYHYCNTCKKANSWMMYACSGTCYKVYEILEEIREGVMTVAEAKETFARIGITAEYATEHFIPAVARDIIKVISVGVKIEKKATSIIKK